MTDRPDTKRPAAHGAGGEDRRPKAWQCRRQSAYPGLREWVASRTAGYWTVSETVQLLLALPASVPGNSEVVMLADGCSIEVWEKPEDRIDPGMA